MSFFEDHRGEPSHACSPEQVSYLRSVLRVHANVAATGACAICRTRCCPDWRHAYDQLAVAGELMAEPAAWLSQVGGSPSW